MSNPSEREFPRGIEIMQFSYKGERVTIPVASNIPRLKKFVKSRIMPGLETVLSQAVNIENAGIGFVRYFYTTDNWDFIDPEGSEEYIKGLKKRMQAAGFTPIENPKKSDPVRPESHDLVAYMKKFPDIHHRLNDFKNGTFLIGPLTAKGPLTNTGYYYDEELARTYLYTDSTVAIHGETLLADFPEPKTEGVIHDEEIIERLMAIFHPFELL